MFHIGDSVLYGADGVCTITDLAVREFCGTEREYYILQPDADPHGIVYVPTDNPSLVGKMRRLLTREEINEIFAEFSPEDGSACGGESPDWIENDAERKHTYEEILQSGDRRQIIRIIRALYLHRENLKKRGKKLHIADERIFREAEGIMNAELAYVLSIRPADVPAYIAEKIHTATYQG